MYVPETHDASSSVLGVVSLVDDLPFTAKRIYWVRNFDAPVTRGGHAHRETAQALLALTGTIEIRLISPWMEETKFTLEPDAGLLLVPPGFWRDIHLSSRAVLLAVVSTEFSEKDYIRDFLEFQEWAANAVSAVGREDFLPSSGPDSGRFWN